MSSELMTVGPLQQALALATEAGDIKALRDVAAMGAALQKGARARGMGIEAENQAAEVIIRAERAIGRALPDPKEVMSQRASLRATAGNQYGPTTEREEGAATDQPLLPTAAELGFDIKTAWLFRQLAAIPDSVFEDKVAGLLATGERFAKLDFYRLVRGGDKVASKAREDIREAMHSEDATREFVAFRKAAAALDLSTLPEDELIPVAIILQRLLNAYNEERTRRSAAA